MRPSLVTVESLAAAMIVGIERERRNGGSAGPQLANKISTSTRRSSLPEDRKQTDVVETSLDYRAVEHGGPWRREWRWRSHGVIARRGMQAYHLANQASSISRAEPSRGARLINPC